VNAPYTIKDGQGKTIATFNKTDNYPVNGRQWWKNKKLNV